MPTQEKCPFCNQPIEPEQETCPHCGQTISTVPAGEIPPSSVDRQFTPEMLVHRLGDYLLESGVITKKDLNRALEYQRELAPSRHVLLGQALLELGLVDRDTLDQAITRQLLSLQNALMETNRLLEDRVAQRTKDLERRLVQIRTAADITQLAISASSLSELLRRAVDLIVERFEYYLASIFIVDESGENAILAEASGRAHKDLMAKGVKIGAGSRSMVGWVLVHRKARVAAEVGEDYFYLSSDQLMETRSEVCIPILMGDHLLGVLDVQHSLANAFDPDAVAVLQIIANHIASVMQSFRLLETTRTSLSELSSLYYASYQLARAERLEDVTSVVTTLLEQSPYFAMFLLPRRNTLQVLAAYTPGLPEWGMGSKPPQYPEAIEASPAALNELFAQRESAPSTAVPSEPYLVLHSITDTEQTAAVPEALLGFLRQAGYQSVALLPSRRSGTLDALVLLATPQITGFATGVLQAYASLAELSATALDKVRASQRMLKQMNALATLNTISQAVSVETDLQSLYQVIHREVIGVMGNVNFAIAVYDQAADTITVPYMFDGKEVRSVPAFPLGEGLTSILIRTRKSLMLVEDTERKTREMGAKLVGKPALSWLGVPLLVAGDVLGAILAQDLEREGRFDEDDQRLMETLASQVAVAVRNARLLESTYRQAERERLLYEITNKIRYAPDIPHILEATTRELSHALGARRATIQLGMMPEQAPEPPQPAAEVPPPDQPPSASSSEQE